jgi:isoquinoline 1-oxidoreductase subunit beta
MTMDTLSRRDFLTVSAAAGGGLLLGCRVGGGTPGESGSAAVPATPAFAPNAFVQIGSDGKVTLIMPAVEMGQGTYTSLPMLIAEELEVPLDQVALEHAPPNDKLYANPFFHVQETGASSSVRAFHEPLRKAGAAARSMLVAAAAAGWQVDPGSCKAVRGTVTHPPTGRSATYGALADRAAKLPVPEEVPLKDPKDFKLIGTRARRLDTPSKVDGTARFGIDVRLPGMGIATLAASPVVGGKVASINEARARSIKGVRQVVRLDDMVAVVADHMWAAKQGLAALAVTWDDGPNATASTADVVKGLAEASAQTGAIARKEGDAPAAVAGAARKIEAIYEVPLLAHATMEPMNCTVDLRKDTCEIWTGCQSLTRAQTTAAALTGLPIEKVVVHNHLLGGGFGRRLEVDYVVQAVRIAQQVKGPVKVVWTREEDTQHGYYRPYYYDRIAAGLNSKGRPVGWTHRIVGPSIIARRIPQIFKDIDIDGVDGAVQLLYDIPAVQVEYLRHEEPVVNTGWWRGVGVTHNTFVIESFIDELASAAKTDPVAYRRSLLGKAPRARGVLDKAAKEAGWGQPLPAGHGRGVSLLYSAWGSYLAQVAEVAVSSSGEIRVHRVVCAVDCGQLVNPDIAMAQMEGGIVFGITAALWSQITLKNGRVEQSSFPDYRIMRFDECPKIEVHLMANGEAPGGLGEPGTACVAAAVANAVAAATGKRVRKLPLQANLASA